MEEEQQQPLFGLTIDPAGRGHIAEAARWAKFLAIIGFIFCGIIVCVGIGVAVLGTIPGSTTSNLSRREAAGLSGFIGIIYAAAALLYFFPCLYLFRFAVK